MQADKLNNLISVLAPPSGEQDPETGYLDTAWTRKATMWANIAPLSGNEYISAGGVNTQLRMRVTVRYTKKIADTIKEQWGIEYRGQTYRIEAILPDNVTGRDYLTLMCSRADNLKEGLSDEP